MLDNNKLQNVEGLKNLNFAYRLDLNENQLQNVDGLRNLKTVDRLRLYKNQLHNVDGLKSLKTVTYLYPQQPYSEDNVPPTFASNTCC